MKTYTLNQAKNNLIGKVRTIERDQYEFELKLELNTMKNERKQTNRNVEQNRSSGSKHSTNDNRDEQSKRPFDWDARDIETNTWIRGGTGKYEDRFFE